MPPKNVFYLPHMTEIVLTYNEESLSLFSCFLK